MFDTLITLALRQRVFIILSALLVLGYGIYAVNQISIEAFPDVQDVQVQVVTQAPGQAPEEVERTISLPIEREMSGVPGMTQLRSVSITGLSVVTLTFNEKTADYFARQQVLERLQQVSLPPGSQPTLAPLTTAVGAALVLLCGLLFRARKQGRTDAIRDFEEADRAEADAIRRRVAAERDRVPDRDALRGRRD